jgi:5-methylthioadenosine/S-adenosylhomocysteine deaminase
MANKPLFVLKGRIVTMTSEDDIIEEGFMAIKDGLIAGIFTAKDQLPEEFLDKEIVETNGTIFPGLIDLHNHFVYNVLTLWVVPKAYSNRSQWPAHAEYKARVSKPIKQVLAKYGTSAKAVVRYVEAKALIGGTTTGQGMRTKVNGGSKIFKGVMRNVEEPDNSELPAAGTLVPDLIVTGATAQERINSFRKALNDPARGAYFYHLSEGIDARARQHFSNLVENDLINEKLVGIHALGLTGEDLKLMASKRAKAVWSPFSNQLLYGRTIPLKDLKSSGVAFSLGCDWTPTGSKNLLFELKVAFHISKEQGDIFTPFELVQMVTSKAALVTGWQEYLGTIEVGKLADLVVIKGSTADPYFQLIKSIEKDIELVVVDGVARYGNWNFMKQLEGDFDLGFPLEEITIAKVPKGIYLFSHNSEINNVTFTSAVEIIQEACSDLPAFAAKMQDEEATLLSPDSGEVPQNFSIELDNEFEIEADVFQEYDPDIQVELMAEVEMAENVEFDTAIVEGQNYWNRIDAQQNISSKLKAWLKECYTTNL